MKSSSFSVVAALLLAGVPLHAQQPNRLNSLSSVVELQTPEKLVAKRSQSLTAEVIVKVRDGYHINSDVPADQYLIPLKLTWDEEFGKVGAVEYPKPSMEKFPFTEKPMSVLQGTFATRTRVTVPATAKPGLSHLTGKLRYQACNDRMCLPPRSLEIKIPVEVRP